ncbi:unnamed protein product [Ectocarpus sp. CCAP 1310/34]|nr:unnamed protein product [Ectocarpus sp. CCAP 1310/34]
MISRVCPPRMLYKARARLVATEIASAVRQECCLAVGTPSRRQLGTTAAASTAGGNGSRGNRQQQQDMGEEGGRREGSDATVGASQYTLPPPTWSLSDLNVTDDDERGGDPARNAVLSNEEVAKLCALAHIELAPEGADDSCSNGGLDVSAVKKDVGAMLRCMQTMRRENDDSSGGGGGRRGNQEMEGEEGEDGPWGGAVSWAAPLEEDVVSDGGIQKEVLGAAQHTEDGFFTAPKVV